MSKYPILDSISSPKDVKALSADKLPLLADEIRSFLIEKISYTGGHLASNLGVVELTISLVRALDLPSDRVIFDVGHQSYVYKILTDRKSRIETIRKPGGLSGFEKRSESEYDCYGTGHSSTSVSAAIGFARSDLLQKRKRTTVAVLGDGAFTGGLVHEALNNIDENLPLIIILNENEMSISRNIGGFAKTIARLRAKGGYYSTKRKTRELISSIPLVGDKVFEFFKKSKQSIKNSIYSSNYFEDLGLYYLGPADGNDTEQVSNLLDEAILSGKACIIHLKTVKGKGYDPAEKNPGKYHSVSEGLTPAHSYCFSEAMGSYITKKASENGKICAITAAMADGCGLIPFKKAHPDRFFDVGIAEGHAIVFAAGLAAGGMRPIVPIYSSFLQRAYDSIIHDVALQSLPVTVMVDRASLAEGDGPTHHGIFDVSFISSIPGTELYAPSTFSSLEKMIDLSLEATNPIFIRYPHSTEFKGAKSLKEILPFVKCSFTVGDCLDFYIITYGRILSEAIKAKEALEKDGKRVGIILLEKLHPINTEEILSLIPESSAAVFLEEGIKRGGIGEEFALSASKSGHSLEVLAIDDDFADRKENISYYEHCGISADHVCKKLAEMRK
ncbi:MAG: 1-deoxy-D-xylulose-5-phosphate synthase [Clostridia bacterium]|nr:1-deoxy-D-xylulose-5-phosphate synthase [Clostridia bacterium]